MSRSELRLQAQLQRSLQRRLRIFQQRLQIPDDDGIYPADPFSADQLASLQWEVESVQSRITPLSSSQSIHSVPSSLMNGVAVAASSSSSNSSSPMTVSLASLHPSREFASAHLEPALAAIIDENVNGTRFWLERIEWSLVNYSVEESLSRMELVQLSVCEEDAQAETQRRVRFLLPILQSLRLPCELTLSCHHIVDEQSSQIAYHCAQSEQAAGFATEPPLRIRGKERAVKGRSAAASVAAVSSSRTSAAGSGRPVRELEYLRFRDEIRFIDEQGDTTEMPVTASLIPCLARVLHSYSLPLSLSTTSFFHALSGFDLRHLLSDSFHAGSLLPSSLFEPPSLESLMSELESLVRQSAWPSYDYSSCELEPGKSIMLSEYVIGEMISQHEMHSTAAPAPAADAAVAATPSDAAKSIIQPEDDESIEVDDSNELEISSMTVVDPEAGAAEMSVPASFRPKSVSDLICAFLKLSEFVLEKYAAELKHTDDDHDLTSSASSTSSAASGHGDKSAVNKSKLRHAQSRGKQKSSKRR